MKRIEEIKNSLAEAMAALNAARDEGIRMSADSNASNEDLQKKMAEVERAKARVQLLQDQLSEMENDQSQQAKMKQAADEDRIQAGAKAFKNAGDFFNAVAHANGNMDSRLVEYASIKNAATGQNLTVDSEGGFLVPPDYAAELLQMAKSESVLHKDVRKTSIAGNRLIENYVESTTRADSSEDVKGRTGLLAYWQAEAEQYKNSKMSFAQRETPLMKLTGMAYATEESLEDIPALGSMIAEAFRDEFSFKIDDAILNGTGVGMPLGMLTDANTALVKVSKESGQVAASIVLANLLKMYNALPANLRSKARWYCNQDVETLLMQMVMNNPDAGANVLGVPLWLPGNSLAETPNSRIMGIQLVPVEQCSAVGTAGDIALLVPDQYRWIDKGGIKAQTSIHVRFDYGETAFRFTYRAGGRPLWPNAITAYKGGTKRSPYVTLENRA